MNKVTIEDKRRGYKYVLGAMEGQNFAPDFNPELTPKEMLKLGVFGGTYFADGHGGFPDDWFKEAKESITYNEKLNFFGVSASQSHETWLKKGWIFPEDPKGWFQWYCRYYLGRRMPEIDQIQIKRWKAMKRHVAQVRRNCVPGDLSCRPRQRQALLHWAYDSRKI